MRPLDDSVAFRALLDATLDHIFVVDRELRYTHVSVGGAAVLGLTPEMMTGRTWRELGLPASLMDGVEQEWQHSLATGETIRRELPFDAPAGTRYFEYYTFPIRMDDAIVAAATVARDITARTSANDELRRADERYRALIAHRSEGIWRFELAEPVDTSLPVDEQVRLCFDRAVVAEGNDAVARMYGFQRGEELIGMPVTQMLDPAVEANRDYLRAFVISGYRLDNTESLEIDRFGQRKYFVNSLTGIVENGRLTRVWGMQREITDEKAWMERLRLSEERLQALVATASQVVWTADAAGGMEWITPSWAEVTGQPLKEAKGDGWLQVVHPDDRERSRVEWQTAVESRTLYRNDIRVRMRDGNYRWFRNHAAPVLNDDGSLREWVGSSTDIDAERRQEEILASDQWRAEFIAEANDIFVRTLDYEETLRSVARLTVPRLSDWCAVDMVEPDGSLRRLAVEHVDPSKVRLAYELQERYPPGENASHGPHQVLTRGQTEFVPLITDDFVLRLARSEEHGELLRQLQLRSYICTPIRVGDDVAGALTLVNAESERTFTRRDVELAEALALRAGHAIENARLYRQAVEANRAKDEFLATLSHELRTPLTAILGWANLVRLSNYNRDTLISAVNTIERSAKTQASIIDDLLDVSRIITGKFHISPVTVDVVTILRAVVDAARPAADGRRLTINVTTPPSLTVRADPNRLQQMVWNLMSNAVKFSDEGQSIDVAVEQVDDDAVFRVTDQGLGIAPAVLPRVFERFWQADSSSNRSHGGLGLGLAIVRHLAEMHGGTVEAFSEGRGKGATFIIRLPVGAVCAQPATSAVEAAADGTRVLLVDDDDNARQVIARMLEHYGARVRQATSAPDAVHAADRERFDLVLTDLAMPDHDGYWLLDRIRAAHPDLRVAAITALGITDDEISAAGFDAFVRKPVDPARLAELLA